MLNLTVQTVTLALETDGQSSSVLCPMVHGTESQVGRKQPLCPLCKLTGAEGAARGSCEGQVSSLQELCLTLPLGWLGTLSEALGWGAHGSGWHPSCGMASHPRRMPVVRSPCSSV